MKKVTVLILIFGTYTVLLLSINILHFHYFTVNVVFYATLANVMVATVIMTIAVAMVRKFSVPNSWIGIGVRQLTGTEVTLSVICTMLTGYIFAISVPTVIDRSLSIYILEKLDQRGGEISFAAMSDIFVKEYVPEHRLLDVRLIEQLSSGTIIIENDCVKLTPRGERIVDFTRFYRTRVLPKKRVLMGEISDDLTDPFRNSVPAVDYRCRASKIPE